MAAAPTTFSLFVGFYVCYTTVRKFEYDIFNFRICSREGSTLFSPCDSLFFPLNCICFERSKYLIILKNTSSARPHSRQPGHHPVLVSCCVLLHPERKKVLGRNDMMMLAGSLRRAARRCAPSISTSTTAARALSSNPTSFSTGASAARFSRAGLTGARTTATHEPRGAVASPRSMWNPPALSAFHTSSGAARPDDGESAPQEDSPGSFMSVEDSVARLMDRSQMSKQAVMKEEWRDLAREFGGDEFNTGASEVQIAIMTRKVANMTEFLKNNRKDKHNTRALQLLLSKRRKMLKYLMRQSRTRYYNTINKLGLRDIYGDKVLKRRGAVKKYPAAKMKGSY